MPRQGSPLKATERYVTKGGNTYKCAREVRYTARGDYKFWRCGKCKRGKLQTWDSECAVCHATVVPA